MRRGAIDARAVLVLLGGPALLIVLGVVLGRTEMGRGLRATLRPRAVPPVAMKGDLGRLLRRAGLVRAVPLDPAGVPSTVAVPAERVAAGAPLVSVHVRDEYLHDPRFGLRVNVQKRGVQWERPAWVSFFDGGSLRLAAAAGLRVHGGGNRDKTSSYRLYFREDYGLPGFDAGFLGEDPRTLQTLVVRDDPRLSTALSWELARRMGLVVPAHSTVAFFLNGEDTGPHTLCAFPGRDEWARRVGHQDFTFFKYKSDAVRPGDIAGYNELLEWARALDGDVTLDEVEAGVDLDNLSRHLLLILFCGVTDWRQGVAYLDRTVAEPRWSWITWDTDTAFWDYYAERREFEREVWTQEASELLTTGRRWYGTANRQLPFEELDARELIFTRLWGASPGFRARFLRTVTDQLNHVLTPAACAALVDHWRDAAEAHGFGEGPRRALEQARVFLEHRPAFLRRDLGEHLGAPPCHRVRLDGPDDVRYLIDGRPVRGDYEGWYFEGQLLHVRIVDPGGRSHAGWRVGETELPKKDVFTVAVGAGLSLSPRFD